MLTAFNVLPDVLEIYKTVYEVHLHVCLQDVFECVTVANCYSSLADGDNS